MSKYHIPRLFKLEDVPEYRRFQDANPGKDIHELNSIIMFGRAIHWLAIVNILWPRFEILDYYSVEVKYIVYNDPDSSHLPIEFYEQIRLILDTFWKIQLEDLYPNGKWEVKLHNDPEMTIDATIYERG